MITDKGKQLLLRYIAGQGGGPAETMVLGIGTTAPTVDDKFLDFEVLRADVELVDFDAAQERVFLRAVVPASAFADIYEAGIIENDANADTESPSFIIFSFDFQTEENWAGPFTENEDVTRLGASSMELDSPGTMVHDETFGMFDTYEQSDEFALAYEVVSGNVSEVKVRFHVGPSDFREYTFAPDAGYSIHRWKKSDFTQTGSAHWDEFEYAEFEAVGNGDIVFDAMRIDSFPTLEDDEVLVAKSVVATPVELRPGVDAQIEYSLEVSFT